MIAADRRPRLGTATVRAGDHDDGWRRWVCPPARHSTAFFANRQRHRGHRLWRTLPTIGVSILVLLALSSHRARDTRAAAGRLAQSRPRALEHLVGEYAGRERTLPDPVRRAPPRGAPPPAPRSSPSRPPRRAARSRRGRRARARSRGRCGAARALSPALGNRLTRCRQCSACSSTSSWSSRAAVSCGSSPSWSHSPAGSSTNTPRPAWRYWRRQQTRSLLVEREHHDRARVLDDEAPERLVGVVGALHGVLAQRHHPVVAVEVAGAQHGPAEVLVGELRHGRGPGRRSSRRSCRRRACPW